MRYLVLLSVPLLLLVGCHDEYEHLISVTTPTLPTHLSKQVITVIADQDYSTIPAYHTGKLIVFRELVPIPDLVPNVKIGDTCPHCKGTGREPGDGTIDISCGQCNGDGVVDEGDPIIVDTEEMPKTKSN